MSLRAKERKVLKASFELVQKLELESVQKNLIKFPNEIPQKNYFNWSGKCHKLLFIYIKLAIVYYQSHQVDKQTQFLSKRKPMKLNKERKIHIFSYENDFKLRK